MEKIKAKAEPATYDGIEKDSDPTTFGPGQFINAPESAKGDRDAVGDVNHGPGIELAKKVKK